MSDSLEAPPESPEPVTLARRLLPAMFWAMLVPSLLLGSRPWLSALGNLLVLVTAAWVIGRGPQGAQVALLAGRPRPEWGRVTAALVLPALLWIRLIAAPFIMLWPEAPLSVLPDLGNALALLGVLLLAPVFEELMFRGVLLQALTAWGRLPALIVTSVLFGLAHGPVQSLSTVMFGWALGWLALEFRSVWPPIILHLSFNLSSWLLASTEALPGTTGTVIAAVLLTGTAIGGLWMTIRHRQLLWSMLAGPWREVPEDAPPLGAAVLGIVKLWPVGALAGLISISWLLMLIV